MCVLTPHPNKYFHPLFKIIVISKPIISYSLNPRAKLGGSTSLLTFYTAQSREIGNCTSNIGNVVTMRSLFCLQSERTDQTQAMTCLHTPLHSARHMSWLLRVQMFFTSNTYHDKISRLSTEVSWFYTTINMDYDHLVHETIQHY